MKTDVCMILDKSALIKFYWGENLFPSPIYQLPDQKFIVKYSDLLNEKEKNMCDKEVLWKKEADKKKKLEEANKLKLQQVAIEEQKKLQEEANTISVQKTHAVKIKKPVVIIPTKTVVTPEKPVKIEIKDEKAMSDEANL